MAHPDCGGNHGRSPITNCSIGTPDAGKRHLHRRMPGYVANSNRRLIRLILANLLSIRATAMATPNVAAKIVNPEIANVVHARLP